MGFPSDANAPADCAHKKDLQMRAFAKRLMGFEPTTFCMASRTCGPDAARTSLQAEAFSSARVPEGFPAFAGSHGGLGSEWVVGFAASWPPGSAFSLAGSAMCALACLGSAFGDHPGEQGELLGRLAAGIGVVDGEGLAVGVRDRQFLVAVSSRPTWGWTIGVVPPAWGRASWRAHSLRKRSLRTERSRTGESDGRSRHSGTGRRHLGGCHLRPGRAAALEPGPSKGIRAAANGAVFG
jgi:hypothetical protein